MLVYKLPTAEEVRKLEEAAAQAAERVLAWGLIVAVFLWGWVIYLLVGEVAK